MGAMMAREAAGVLMTHAGPEIGVASTKAFTAQLAALFLLAMYLGQVRGELDAEFSRELARQLLAVPAKMERLLSRTEPYEELVKHLFRASNFLYLGRGIHYPIALEGALKIKEITYAHCEGMLSTEFKHGPLSAVREGFPVLFVGGPEDTGLLVSGVNESACRGAFTLVISEPNERLRANASAQIALPPAGPLLNPILAVLPLQLLSYRLSVARGYDPDFPRNLSKTLTVD